MENSPINYFTRDEAAALNQLAAFLGPLPEEWVGSLGMQTSLIQDSSFFMECAGASYVASTSETTLEEMVRLNSKVNDTSDLITLLQQILVLDPRLRPGVSNLLNHPWFAGSEGPVTLPEPSSSDED